MSAQVAGNTNAATFCARSFLFTFNEIKNFESFVSEIRKIKCLEYFVAALENAPTTNHEHIHAFAHFSRSHKLSKKLLAYGAHIDCCKFPMKAIDYVKKEGNIIEEFGEPPHQGKILTCAELMQIKKKEDVPWNMLNTWNKLQPTKIKKSEWSKQVEVHYIYGPSGVGKSNLAQELADDEFDEVKFVNGFWSPCSGTGCCIYDDFRDSHMPASEFINFIDYRTHNLNVKGGTVRNAYNKIIITSVQPPECIYSNLSDEPRKQWMRRIQTHFLQQE